MVYSQLVVKAMLNLVGFPLFTCMKSEEVDSENHISLQEGSANSQSEDLECGLYETM